MKAPFRLLVRLPDGAEHAIFRLEMHESGIIECVETVAGELGARHVLRGQDLEKVRLGVVTKDTEYWTEQPNA